MSDLVERLKDLIADRAGGSTSEPNYDPDLLDVGFTAADRLEQLERVLAQALATLKDGDMDMVHATIAAIDEALNHQASG